MTVRSTMPELITRVRNRINDNPSDPNSRVFTDQEVQDDLDRYRLVARLAPLEPRITAVPGGIIHYHDYYASFGDWEEGEILYDNRFAMIDLAPPDGLGTLVSRDLLTGHWTFTDNPSAITLDGYANGMPFGQIPVVRITGFTYDTWMASAVLLEKWAAKVALEFNFSTNQQTFYRNQQFTMLMQLAETYKESARNASNEIFRLDQTDASALPTAQYLNMGYFGA